MVANHCLLPLRSRFTTRAKTDALNCDRLQNLPVTEFVYEAHEFPGYEANGKPVSREKMKKYLLNVMVPQELVLKVRVGSKRLTNLWLIARNLGRGASHADQGANRGYRPMISGYLKRTIEPCSRIVGEWHSRPSRGFQDCSRRHEQYIMPPWIRQSVTATSHRHAPVEEAHARSGSAGRVRTDYARPPTLATGPICDTWCEYQRHLSPRYLRSQQRNGKRSRHSRTGKFQTTIIQPVLRADAPSGIAHLSMGIHRSQEPRSDH